MLSKAVIIAISGMLIFGGCAVSGRGVNSGQNQTVNSHDTQNDVTFNELNDACTPQNVQACMNAAAYLYKTKNYEYSAWYYNQICSRFQHIPACLKLAEMFESGTGVSKDAQKANDIYDRACNMGDKPSCKKVKLK